MSRSGYCSHLRWICLTLSLFFANPTHAAPAAKDYSGQWDTTFGRMTLTQNASEVSGRYVMNGIECSLSGKLQGTRLQFRYQEPQVNGEGWFELAANGDHFAGSWRESGQEIWSPWIGKRTRSTAESFAGVWETTFGKLRLTEPVNQEIAGVYSSGGIATLRGKLETGGKLKFSYREKSATGEGWFALQDGGASFKGEWREAGSTTWKRWTGQRVLPVPGRVWLVVLEARWEKSLNDREYAFGDMLKAFFDRTPNVEVRRRSFSDALSLRRWLAEVAFLPEPAVVTIASHGGTDGLKVDGATIDAALVAEGLQHAQNVRALHFSSCLVMQADFGKRVHSGLEAQGLKTTVSGYKNSVDWTVSALFEMTYFDLILSRGLSAADAARAGLKIFPIAADTPMGVPMAPGGFTALN